MARWKSQVRDRNWDLAGRGHRRSVRVSLTEAPEAELPVAKLSLIDM